PLWRSSSDPETPMAKAPVDPQAAPAQAVADAKRLMRLSRTAALATLDPGARARYLQRNPKAKLYADFADFAFFRLAIESVHFNGGFGRADSLAPADILASREAEEALAEAEARLLDWVNALGDEVLARLAGHGRSSRQVWRAIGLDAEGLDLAAGGRAARVQFAAPAHSEMSWRAALERLADRDR